MRKVFSTLPRRKMASAPLASQCLSHCLRSGTRHLPLSPAATSSWLPSHSLRENGSPICLSPFLALRADLALLSGYLWPLIADKSGEWSGGQVFSLGASAGRPVCPLSFSFARVRSLQSPFTSPCSFTCASWCVILPPRPRAVIYLHLLQSQRKAANKFSNAAASVYSV